jgi:hypothetical protein
MMNIRKLPPLILHPFADRGAPDKLVESSRASLMLQGLLPSGDRDATDIAQTLLEGRFCEIRMLFYVGKDLLRWIDQCLEIVARDPELRDCGIKHQSFAAYLVGSTPDSVSAKLKKWGVADYQAIFTRALGLSAILAAPPERGDLTDEFIRHYYRYADQLFQVHQGQSLFADICGLGFEFEIYASGEYSRMLEREWAEI